MYWFQPVVFQDDGYIAPLAKSQQRDRTFRFRQVTPSWQFYTTAKHSKVFRVGNNSEPYCQRSRPGVVSSPFVSFKCQRTGDNSDGTLDAKHETTNSKTCKRLNFTRVNSTTAEFSMHGVYNQLLSPAACTPRSQRDDCQTSLVNTPGRRPPDSIAFSYACKEMLE
jgi:hypothetical protein